MAKDKTQETKDDQVVKELSEWQKRHQEYLERKAREKEESDAPDTDEQEKDSVEEVAEQPEKEQEEKTAEPDEEARSNQATPKKEKQRKEKIATAHKWRAFSVLVASLLVLASSAYLLSPLSRLKDITVEGNTYTTSEEIRAASGILDTDYTLALLLNKDKHADWIRSNHWVESASIDYRFPAHFTIKVKEYGIEAYYVSGEEHYPILSSGELTTTAVSLVSLPETYISVLFNDATQVKTLISELNKLSPDLKSAIQKIELAPSAVTADLLLVTMQDTDEILVPLSELSKKMPFYSKVKPQLSVPSLVDMEVGIYSYSLETKRLEEERAKEEARLKEEKEKEEKERQGQTTPSQE